MSEVSGGEERERAALVALADQVSRYLLAEYPNGTHHPADGPADVLSRENVNARAALEPVENDTQERTDGDS